MDRPVVEGDTSGYGGARLAATVILVRDGSLGLEVWVQERVSTMPNYPGMTVFPGGGVDRRDFPDATSDSALWTGPSLVSTARTMGTSAPKAHALVFAAVRELFEETGLLLACHPNGTVIADATKYHDRRLALDSHRLSLTDVLRSEQLSVTTNLVRPWARWVGCSEKGNWFDTFSFVAVHPSGQEPDADSSEADSGGWFPPRLLLDGWRVGLVRLVIPTWAQLRLLSECETVADVLRAANHPDMRPVVGDPVDDPRFQEFFRMRPIDRI